jgi:hypothetical protein
MGNVQDSFEANRAASRSMRALAIVLGLAVSACSSIEASSIIGPYVAPSAPTLSATLKGAKQAAVDEKLTGFIEMSDVRESDHGPGRFVLCLRGASGFSPRRTYAVFFDNEEYKGARLSVIVDDCEKQDFRPFDQSDDFPASGPQARR